MTDVEVSFEQYFNYCSQCTDAKKDYETLQKARIARLNMNDTLIPLKCAKTIPCTQSGVWEVV